MMVWIPPPYSGMNVIGRRFKADEIFLPEVMIAARSKNAGLEILDPLLSKTGAKPRGGIVLGTVKGDLHDVGGALITREDIDKFIPPLKLEERAPPRML